MTPNVGRRDRALRVVLGAVLLFLGWTEMVQGWPGIALMVGGLIPFVSGFTGFCPLYALLGVDTRPGPTPGPGSA